MELTRPCLQARDGAEPRLAKARARIEPTRAWPLRIRRLSTSWIGWIVRHEGERPGLWWAGAVRPGTQGNHGARVGLVRPRLLAMRGGEAADWYGDLHAPEVGVSRPRPAPRLHSRLSGLIAAAYDLGNRGLERRLLGERRRRLLDATRGAVLDVGGGTGANLPYLAPGQVTRLVLLDPSPGMLARARRRARELELEVELVRGRAERLPFLDRSFDAVVFTLSLCTIGEPAVALGEARRVLRRDGRLLVLEHVRAADPRLAGWQDRLTPLWRRIGGGCHLNRDTRSAISAAGFRFESVDEFLEERIPIAVLQPQLIGVARRDDRDS